MAAAGTVIGQYNGQNIYSGSDADVSAQMAKIDGGTISPSVNGPAAPKSSSSSSTPAKTGGVTHSSSTVVTGASPSTVPYETAVANLKAGGLTGASLDMAMASLANAYGVGTPSGANYGASAYTPPAQVGTNGDLASNVSSAMNGGATPSHALSSSNSSKSVLGQYQSYFDQYQDYQKQLLSASMPTAEETDLSGQIRDLNTKLAQGVAKIGSQAIPTPLIGLQSQKLNENVATVIKPLQDELDTLVQTRSQKVDALTRVMQASADSIQMFAQIQKLTMPNVIGTQVNPQTGDVYTLTQDASGNVTMNTVGSVGSTVAQKDYTQSGTYQAGDGTQWFYGVSPDGKIYNTQLGGAGGGSGGTFSTTQTNNGAQNAGVDATTFGSLPYNVRNFFVNAPAGNIKSVNDTLKGVQNGTISNSSAKSWVANLGVPQDMKDYLNQRIDSSQPSSSGSGNFDLVSWLGGAASAIGNWAKGAIGINSASAGL